MGLIKKIVAAVGSAAQAVGSAFETKSLSPSQRAYYTGLLIFVGQAELDKGDKYGAAEAARLVAEGTDWSIFLGRELAGKDIRDVNTERTIDQFPDDSVWIVAPNAPDGDTFDLIAKDYSKWRKGLNKIVGKSYDAKNERDRERLAIAITIGATVAAVAVSIVATPAAGAAVGAAGAALVGVVEAGGDSEAIAAAVMDGTADAAAALQESDPDTAAVLEDAAEQVLAVVETVTTVEGETVTTVEAGELSPVDQLVADVRAWGDENPALAAGLAAGAVGAGLLLLRALIRA